jgi:molybdopterin-containing oxidoreductase family membrane subunit
MFVAYIFRRVYDWEDVLPDEIFHGLGWWMGLFGLLWLWFQLQKLITGAYAPTRDVEPVVNTMLHSNVYWLAVGLVAVPLAYVAFQHFGILDFSVRGTVIAGVGVILGVLIDKTLFVVEGLIYASTRLYENVPGAYVPTPIEMASLLGTVSMIVLFFLGISKLVPIVELKAVKEHETETETGGD